ncbi:MAG: tol-pal system-associated acyl-CoA thioesterase [Polycyclovorans sp.]|jgi:acyl-CoA thioester hydrolase|nr:tol-pal system-associated acyl-CoA thioesterase [Polycyclovorans sp.]MBU0791463.1 tol-pal system-associated acyl-CoA thioesterase [Gammaproteobacteria bacterium]|tara:strand:+ start:64840 stop:65250 length:411 start_codon:yes stop_codon:yes gene_type:complete
MNNSAHELQLRVYWEDTDASGVVYHANYLKWAERGRTEWLRALGGEQQRWIVEAGIAFTVAEMTVRYRRPARLDDRVLIKTELGVQRRASLMFEQRVLLADSGELLAQMSVKAGCVDVKTFRPRPLPEWFFSQNSG